MTNDTPTAGRGLRFGIYDFSNSGYVLMFQSFLFPVLVAQSGLARPEAWWGVTVAVSSCVAIVLSPFVGRYADRRGRSTVFPVLVAIAAFGAILVPQFFASAPIFLLCAFLLFNAAFEISQTLYDSFLTDISSSPSDTVRISSFAWGIGYVGGAVFAGIYFVLNRNETPEPEMLTAFGVLYLVLSLPAIYYFRRKARGPETPNNRREGLWPRPALPWRDLAIYWIVADAVAAVLYFAPLYVQREIGLSTMEVGGLMLLTQVFAFFLTILMGRVANRIGHIPMLRLCIAIWAVALLILTFAQSMVHVVMVMVAISFVIGSTQAILRAHYAIRVGLARPGEAFGFYAVAQKGASVIAPAVIAGTIAVTGEMRPGFFILFIALLAGYILSGNLPETSEHVSRA